MRQVYGSGAAPLAEPPFPRARGGSRRGSELGHEIVRVVAAATDTTAAARCGGGALAAAVVFVLVEGRGRARDRVAALGGARRVDVDRALAARRGGADLVELCGVRRDVM